MANELIPELREFDDVKRHLIGPVMVPQRFDLHGDGFTANEVEFSCHYYNKNHFGDCDINHAFGVDCCQIVESYLLENESSIGDKVYPAGTWIAKMEVAKTPTGDVIWEAILDGVLDGFSPEGGAIDYPIVKE